MPVGLMRHPANGSGWSRKGEVLVSPVQAARRDLVTRHELKYLIPRELVPEIRRFIRPFCAPDPHTHGNPPEYQITTLQLDDHRYSLHFAKDRELTTRFKLRVRTYGEIGSAPVFTEVKAKLGGMVHKWRALIPFEQWSGDLVTGTALPDVFRSRRQEIDFLQFKRLTWELGARPEVLIRYWRESYVGSIDGYARVTFDRNLQYQMSTRWTGFGQGGRWRGIDSPLAQGAGLPYSAVILEVKTLAHPPMWVLDLVERFQLHRRGFCKYSTALNREGSFRRWPPMSVQKAEELAQV